MSATVATLLASLPYCLLRPRLFGTMTGQYIHHAIVPFVAGVFIDHIVGMFKYDASRVIRCVGAGVMYNEVVL